MAKNDKIFNNSFDTPEFELSNISFELDPSVKDTQPEEDKIHFEMIARKIHELIGLSRFKVFNEVDEQGKCNKLRNLIQELDLKTGILEKKNIKKLF